MLIQLSKSTKGAIACAAITLGLAACASTPVPNEKIAVAKASVQRAEQSGAPELAPVEMAAAVGGPAGPTSSNEAVPYASLWLQRK